MTAMAQFYSKIKNMAFRVAYLQSVTGGRLLVIPALLLLFLLFHLHSSTASLRLLFFSGQSEPLPLSIPSLRVLRVLHRPTNPETSEYLHFM